MSVYIRDGRIRNHFNEERCKVFDPIGKNATKDFCAELSFDCCDDFDVDENNVHDHSKPDLRAKKNDCLYYFEAESKRFENMHRYVRGGGQIDILERKAKYAVRAEGVHNRFVSMCDYQESPCRSNKWAGNYMALVPLETLLLAEDHCGKEYLGHRCRSSEGFVSPEHGCIRLRKPPECGMHQNGKIEDFFRIPYDFLYFYERDELDLPYRLVDAPTRRVRILKDGSCVVEKAVVDHNLVPADEFSRRSASRV